MQYFVVDAFPNNISFEVALANSNTISNKVPRIYQEQLVIIKGNKILGSKWTIVPSCYEVILPSSG